MDGLRIRTEADRHLAAAVIALAVVLLLLTGMLLFWHEGTRRPADNTIIDNFPRPVTSVPYYSHTTMAPYAPPTTSYYYAPSTIYRPPSTKYVAPSYTVPTTAGINPMAQVAPGGNGYTAPDGSFSVVFPAPHTYANPTTLQVGGIRATATEVAVANGGTPWGFWVAWSEPMMSAQSASQILATECFAQDPGEKVLVRAPIAIGGQIGISCRIGGPWTNDYAYVYAHNRLFMLDTSGQVGATYAEFQTFVRSLKLGPR
jgi:hypothetical protein